jgi:hypothetical protein
MQMKKSLALVALAASLGLGSVASAAPVTLDPWMAAQSVSASSSSTTPTSVLPAPVLGVADFFGDRTLGAVLTSPSGTVSALIGGSTFECNRSVVATGYCFAEYEVTQAFSLESVDYGAVNDGAFGGMASVSFYKGLSELASQSIAMGSSTYSTLLNSSFAAGDTFRIALFGSVAIDQSLLPLQGNVVPAPGSLALAGLGFVGLALTRRRQNVVAA